MSKVADMVATLAEPLVTSQGCRLWDVEYVKEAGNWFLRIYIDKEGGVFIDDCENISRIVSDLLDEADPISESYTFEVSSAGADRVLKKPAHFEAYLNTMVDLRLYKARNGTKNLTGILSGYDSETITLTVGAETIPFPHKEVAQVRLHVSF